MLVWLLTLALPLQGLAASMRLSCHAAPVPAMPAADEATPCHQADALAAASATGDSGAARQSIAGHANHAGCIACAACHGVAAALPASVILPSAEAPSVAPDSRVPGAALPYITDGPDRPPRSLDA